MRLNALGTAPVLMACAVLVAGCAPGEVTVVGGSTGGGVSRVTLTVRVGVDAADRALADSLGWREGVPDAAVHLLLNGTVEWLVRATDAGGTAVFEGLLPGLYRVYAARTLSAAEATPLGGTVRAFGDGRTTSASPDLQAYGDRPGGLVFSELQNNTAFAVTAEVSKAATYFEVYNNGDTVVHLDGVVFGVLPSFFFADTPFMSCVESAPVREDSTAVYGHWLLRFPGSGRDHPVGPGDARLVAVTAQDHRATHPDLPDLSGAHFELAPPGFADNPGVPNLLDVGGEAFLPSLLWPGRKLYFLVAPVDLTMLPRGFRDGRGRQYVRFPARLVLEVALLVAIWPGDDRFGDRANPPCSPAIHPRFDRYEGGFIEFPVHVHRGPVSLQRRVLRLAADGGKILMNTNTSAVDFVVAPRTPGWIPEP